MTRRGDWIQTYSGGQFWPLDPRAEEVRLIDIAQALSNKCRYAGHTLRFYSVAEHSVLVSRAVAREHALWALLHDAAEAYLADIPRPVKRFLPGWKEIEAGVMRAVCEHFGLPPNEPREVKLADTSILRDEMTVLMAPPPEPWGDIGPGTGLVVQGLAPEQARAAFLDRFEELRREETLRWAA